MLKRSIVDVSIESLSVQLDQRSGSMVRAIALSSFLIPLGVVHLEMNLALHPNVCGQYQRKQILPHGRELASRAIVEAPFDRHQSHQGRYLPNHDYLLAPGSNRACLAFAGFRREVRLRKLCLDHQICLPSELVAVTNLNSHRFDLLLSVNRKLII